jgi:hypothetical protein
MRTCMRIFKELLQAKYLYVVSLMHCFRQIVFTIKDAHMYPHIEGYTHLRHCYRQNIYKKWLHVLGCAFACFVIVYLVFFENLCLPACTCIFCVYTHLHSHAHLMCKCFLKKTLKHPETHPQRGPRRLESGELSGQNWGPPQGLARRLWSAPGACPPDSYIYIYIYIYI